MKLGDMAKALHRPAVYLRGLQTRFELPLLDGARYSGAYLAVEPGLDEHVITRYCLMPSYTPASKAQ